MPRQRQGPRLYLRRNRFDPKTSQPRPDIWYIRDGSTEISTGCGADRLSGPDGAEGKLNDYLAKKLEAAPADDTPDRKRRPHEVYVAEVLAAYAAERAPSLDTEAATSAGFVRHLLAWWGERTLADVKRSTCKDYIAARMQMPDARYKDPTDAPRVSERTASRELDSLGGAIDWWDQEHKLTSVPRVWRPEPPESPREALTRSQAAQLLRGALGWRVDAEGRWTRLSGSARANRAHLRRFILIGLYTGTRHAVSRALLWEESALQAWVDLDAGMIYRRGRGERERKTKRRPAVSLPTRLLAHMRRWRAMDLREEARRRERDPDFRLVSVLHHGGEPLAGKIRTGFEGCVRDGGLPDEITPHWLRHTCATWLMEADAKPWDAAAYTGMSVKTLEDCYGHHRPSHQQGARDALARRGR